jgi:NADH-quinone oxidoreductase subunit J
MPSPYQFHENACVLEPLRAIFHFSFEYHEEGSQRDYRARSTPNLRQLPQRMNLVTATFYYLAAASVASALLAVTGRNPVHSMLWVLALFLHVAGIFLLLGAEFLAAVQVIVYAGAILIFYVFVVMLLDLPDEEARPRFGSHWPIAAAVGLCFATLAWLVRVGFGVAPAATRAAADSAPLGSLRAIGMALFGPFALPFEMASLVLLAAIVGAVVLARRRPAGS